MRLILLLSFSTFAVAQSPVSASAPESAPWQMQDSGTTASLRGIFSVDGTVAWASGTNGTILKTTDGGAHWQKCAIPDAATDGATLDFRGVQAWNANTAIVMSSGKGKLSRLYKTSDGCKTWKLILKNRDKEGFWDALYFDRGQWGWLLGDPIKGQFTLFSSEDKGRNWTRQVNKGLRVQTGTQGAFAASNSSLVAFAGYVHFGSGGNDGSFIYGVISRTICVDCTFEQSDYEERETRWAHQSVPIGGNSESSGIFSIGSRPSSTRRAIGTDILIAVGGDFTKPDDSQRTAASRLEYDGPWLASTTPPHGFRSAVQWSEALKLWITVGTNGSDISRDDGKTWQPLDNGNWNALSLPFVVGPNGRIARLNPAALPPSTP
jgi:photosystem II stability/assembly factor-like uncharacterized protein